MKFYTLLLAAITASAPIASFAESNGMGGHPSDKSRNSDNTSSRVYFKCDKNTCDCGCREKAQSQDHTNCGCTSHKQKHHPHKHSD